MSRQATRFYLTWVCASLLSFACISLKMFLELFRCLRHRLGAWEAAREQTASGACGPSELTFWAGAGQTTEQINKQW